MKHIQLFEHFVNEASVTKELLKKEKQLESLAKKIVKQIPSLPGFNFYKGALPEDNRDSISSAMFSNGKTNLKEINYVRAIEEQYHPRGFASRAFNGAKQSTYAFYAEGDPNGYEPFMAVVFGQDIELPKGKTRGSWNNFSGKDYNQEPEWWVFKIAIGIEGRKIELTENLYIRYDESKKELLYDPFFALLAKAFNSPKMTSLIQEYINLTIEFNALIQQQKTNENFVNEKKNWNDPDPYNIGDEFMYEFPKNKDWKNSMWSSLKDWMLEEWGRNAGIQKNKGFDDAYDTVRSYLSRAGYSV